MQKVTTENIDVIREQIPADQAAHLRAGCITGYLSDDQAHLTVWPDEQRAAISYGADSDWADYTGTPFDDDFQLLGN